MTHASSTAALMAQAGAEVRIAGAGQRFGDVVVLNGIDLDIAPGEVIALLGPSGCGKTTLLRLLAGLMAPSAGKITVGSETVADAATGRLVPPERRSIGMVFQDYALWPHMTIAGNVAFPLEMKRVARAERHRRVMEALQLVGLAGLAGRSPGALSGGQQQRVALARAIVSRPALILFDEPLSNLDRELRETLVIDIAALVRSLGTTAVYVTHDHAEAFAMADRVAVLSHGRILQIADPEALVAAPATAEVAAFLKLGLVAAARRSGRELVIAGFGAPLELPRHFAGADGEGHLFVPRGALSVASDADAPLAGTVIHSLFRGDGYLIHVLLVEGVFLDLPVPQRIQEGSTIGVSIHWDAARWFSAAAVAV